jgi:hypothetical protein
MKRDWKIKALTAMVLLAALGVGVARKNAAPTAEDGPERTIYAMLDAARAGDVKSYLAAHDGTMAGTLRQTVAENSERKFAEYLKESNGAVKGVAVGDPQINGEKASVRVEYVYQDRNEVQTLFLSKKGAGWRIVGSDGDQRVKTIIPYGTPVK